MAGISRPQVRLKEMGLIVRSSRLFRRRIDNGRDCSRFPVRPSADRPAAIFLPTPPGASARQGGGYDARTAAKICLIRLRAQVRPHARPRTHRFAKGSGMPISFQ
jgi:hypothetical protein